MIRSREEGPALTTRIKAQARIEAPFDVVVKTIADFAGLARWNPTVEELVVEGQGVGAVRTYRMGGELVRERLDEISEDGRGYRYSQIEGPLSVDRYEGYVWVRREPDDAALVEWAAKLRGGPVPAALLDPLVRGLFDAGLEGAKAILETEP